MVVARDHSKITLCEHLAIPEQFVVTPEFCYHRVTQFNELIGPVMSFADVCHIH